MRIGENKEKKDQLLKNRRRIFNEKKSEEHRKFFAYGEFDRIGFECVEKFSKFRDISEDARGWIGDRQTHLVYGICEDEFRDEIFYKDGNFFEYQDEEAVQSSRLFIGLTILQFKYSQKEIHQDMEKHLRNCKCEILKLVKDKGLDIKCAVLGTLGSYGLTIIWLADQYTDILKMVTQIRNMSLAESEEKSIFLSSYTIFAQNHKVENSDWEKRMQQIEGNALLHLTLKNGLEEEVNAMLEQWKKLDSSLYHCSGEHDVLIRMRSADVFDIFEKDLNCNLDFFKNFVLQTNVQLCEVLPGTCQDVETAPESMGIEEQKKRQVQTVELNGDGKMPIPELEKIQDLYVELRKEFAKLFPSTAGMVDTLDMLYSDYISKISTVSNEMWVRNFSYQFWRILGCITKFIERLDTVELKKKKFLDIINDLLCDFERQISHIAESNNLVLGTPICQFRYSGQINLMLYAYFGIIKRALQFVYEKQEVNSQDEIVPLIVTEIVPIIQSTLFFDGKPQNKAKIVTINLPMTALYNPVCYYPYLYHELFHYVVPSDRYIRNQILGALMSIKILHSSFRAILCHEVCLDEGQEVLDTFIEFNLLRYIYNFVIQNYEDYVGKVIEGIATVSEEIQTYQNIDELSLPAREYEIKILSKWIDWINQEESISIKDNFMVVFMKYLCHQLDNVKNDFILWEKSCNDTSVTERIGMVREQVVQFIVGLAGITDNGTVEAANVGFIKLTDVLNDEVLEEAAAFIEAIKEGMADIAMVAMGDIDFAEYLLLFTKTKKDLLMGWNHIEEQDIIRIGMVIDFLGENRRGDDDYTDVVDGAKDTYINMYVGLYYSGSRLAEPNYKEELLDEAEKCFLQGKRCYTKYIARYRIYMALFMELQESMLVSKANREYLQNYMKEDCGYWKEYVQVLKDCGNYIQNNDINEAKQKWDEKRKNFEKRIFEQNIQLIYKHQFQDGFEQLNSIRTKTIEENKEKKYNKNMFHLEKAKLITTANKEVPIIGFQKIQWDYKAKSVGELSTLVAEISQQFENSNSRVLGKKEQPIWYRGHQSADYKLLPSIMRKYKEKKEKCKPDTKFSLASFFRQEYEEFKFRADGTSEAIERVGYTDSDYIALMQHHSVASNFLDWTEDALSALYFALEGFFDKKAGKPSKSAILYVFNPMLYNYARQKMILRWELNDDRKLEIEKEVVETARQGGIPNLTASYNVSKYNMYQLGDENRIFDNSTPLTSEDMKNRKWIYYLPLAVYVSRLNKRIQAQSGIFLAYNIYTAPDENDGFDYVALETIQKKYLENYKEDQEICPFLYKIEIEENEREKIADWVRALGMSKEKCYPELANIGERIMR